MKEPVDHPVHRQRRWPVFLVLSLLAVSFFLHALKFRRAREVDLARERHATLLRERPIAATKARRARFYQQRYFLSYPTMVSFAAADLVRRVDGIVPPLQLLAVQVDPDLHDLGFEFTVGAAAAGKRVARRQFAAFLERLANLPGVFATAPAPSPAAAGESGMRVFVVRGRAEFQP